MTPNTDGIPRRLLIALGLYVTVVAAVSFVGWPADLPRLTDWDDDGIAIQPNAAVAATLAGLSLLLHASRLTRLAMACGTVVAVIGLATMLQYALALDFGIDTLLMFDRPWGRRGTIVPGRMGPPGSVSWTLIGTALLLLGGSARLRRTAAALAVLVIAISALSLIGYLYGAESLYTIPTLTVIAFQTATLILASGLGILAAAPEFGPVRRLRDNGAADVLVQRLLPPILAVPVLLGFIALAGYDAGLYNPQMSVALLVLALVGMLLVVMRRGARAVSAHERRLVETSREVSDLNTRLLTSIRELEAVFQAAPVGIAVSRDRACRHVELNTAFADILGVAPGINASLTGPDAGSIRFRVTDEDGRAIAPIDLPLQVAARTGEALVGRTLVVHRVNDTRVIAGSAVPVRQTTGEVTGAIAVFVDVTAERSAAAEREKLFMATRAAQMEAELASRAKDDFLAMLSHELRSPLNAMAGWIQVLKRPGARVQLLDRALETIERNLRTQTRVINDLLDVSRIRTGKFELERDRVDLSAIVCPSVESLRPLAEGKGIAVDLAIPDAPLYVDGDPARLQQMVGNIVHNAIKFTPEGGHVRVHVKEIDDHLEVEVSDDGQGIEERLLPMIFDRFVQAESGTTRRHGGLGLGLAIVKQLAERHGGSVRAESDGAGRGARFTMTLPKAVGRVQGDEAPAKAAIRRAASLSATMDVLIVEDHDDTREALRIALEQWGARVRLASSVEEALMAYAVRAPDVLVSDIGMPDKDGYSLIRVIRDREEGTGRRTLAIAMTGFASRIDHETALRAGFDEHVGKPVVAEDLFERLRALAASRLPEAAV